MRSKPVALCKTCPCGRALFDYEVCSHSAWSFDGHTRLGAQEAVEIRLDALMTVRAMDSRAGTNSHWEIVFCSLFAAIPRYAS